MPLANSPRWCRSSTSWALRDPELPAFDGYLFAFVATDAVFALQIFAEAACADREIARENRYTVVEDIEIRDFVSDVEQRDGALHGIGVICFERIVQREGVNVDDCWRRACFFEEVTTRLHEIALGGDEQHAHLETIGIRIEDLEVEFHGLHIEGNVLFRFPAHEFTGLRFLHAFDGNFLDDDVTSADSSDDLFRFDAGALECLTNGVCDDSGIHDFAIDNCRFGEGRYHDLYQLRFPAAVVDDGCLHQTGADIESDRNLLAAEELHGSGGCAWNSFRRNATVRDTVTGTL